MRIVQESSYELSRTKYPFHTDTVVPEWFKKDLLIDVIIWSKQISNAVGSMSTGLPFTVHRAYLSRLEHTNTEINYQFKLFIRSNDSVDAYMIVLNKSVALDGVVPSDDIIVSTIETIGTFDSIAVLGPQFPVRSIFDLIYGLKFTSRHSSEVLSIPNGIWINEDDSTLMLEHSCSIYPNDILNELIVKNNTTNADIVVQNDVKIINGYNFEIAIDEEEVVDDSGVDGSDGSVTLSRSVLFSVYPGAGEGLAPCKHKRYLGIKSINGIKNTSDNFTITEGNCIGTKLIPTTNTVVVLDKCEPCCKDCDDQLGQIGSDLVDLGGAITSLASRISSLEGT